MTSNSTLFYIIENQRNTFQNIRYHYGNETLCEVRKYESLRLKLASITNSLTYLCKCRQYNLTPRGLKVSWHGDCFNKEIILQSTERKLLTNLINFNHYKKYHLTKEIQMFERNLSRNIEFSLWSEVLMFVNRKYNAIFTKTKQCQIRKFENLHKKETQRVLPTSFPTIEIEQNSDNFDSKRLVNISSKQLTKEQENILQKGMKFSVTLKNVPKLDIISEVEKGIRHLPDEDKFPIQHEVSKILSQKKIRKRNITKKEENLLKSLRNDKSIRVTTADKGNATVVMNQAEYHDKMCTILTGEEYQRIDKDLTQQLEGKIYRTLKKHSQMIDDKKRRKLTAHNTIAPRAYGKPKIHKENIPLRIIINTRDSPTYDLSKYLKSFLKKIKSGENSVKNTPEFIRYIQGVQINENDMLASIDVVNMFTTVPVEKTLTIVRQKLSDAVDLELPVNTIMELLTLCVTTTYFTYGEEYYEQKEGFPMGGPLSPDMCDIFMEDLETKAFAIMKPKAYKRYVDDGFLVWSDGVDALTTFVEMMNIFEEKVKFTLETEKDKKLAFLDVLLDHSNESLKTNIYKKDTNSGIYLNFESNHAQHLKLNIIKNEKKRIEQLCNNNVEKEKAEVFALLKNNDYPENLINKVWQEDFRRPDRRQEIPNIAHVTIPYVKGISEHIQRVCKKHNIRTSFRTVNQLRSLCTAKDNINSDKKKNVIYEIKCDQCDEKYVGETSAWLEKRISQHKNNLRTMNQNSLLVVRSQTTGKS
uniref:Reverse transcriptase domain-containing protein n=1 Tax=Cacopsylla melanoneura TaxID=428564 RepID=A0A8D9BWW7_9HEMI